MSDLTAVETPIRSSSVPVLPQSKRPHVDIASPQNQDDLEKLFLSTNDEIPGYVKIILKSLMDARDQLSSIQQWCMKVTEENSQLRSENADLKKLLEQKDCEIRSLKSSSIPANSNANPVDPFAVQHEFERLRSIVISGIPESHSTVPTERVLHDVNFVHSIINHLDVECLPCQVYRMGKVISDRFLLVKVVLPTARFQRLILQRAPRLRTFSEKGVYIRPSLTKEERLRQREERIARRNARQSLASASVSQPPVNTASAPPNSTITRMDIAHQENE